VQVQTSAGVGRTTMQISAAVVLFGVMAWWVRANRGALALDKRRGSDWRRVAIEGTALAWPVSEGNDVAYRTRPVSRDRGVRYASLREARGGG
jgi:hypothetical protein